MAVGNPYGQGPYGEGPYARFGNTRPFGVGAYGVGPYSGWGGNTFDVAGAASLVFSVHALPQFTLQLYAASSIAFEAWSDGMAVTIQPDALTEIVLTTTAPLLFSWAGWGPCGPDLWQGAGPCEGGTWEPVGSGGAGTWQPVRLA